MFDVNEILAMLQNGENPDTIAQKALDAVNEAQRIQKEKEEEAKRIEAESRLAAQRREAKDCALDDVFVALINYINLFDGHAAVQVSTFWENMTNEEVDELHKSIEGLCQMTAALQKLDGILGDSSSKKLLGGTFANSLHADKIDKILNTAPGTGSGKITSDDDVIANFIKMWG